MTTAIINGDIVFVGDAEAAEFNHIREENAESARILFISAEVGDRINAIAPLYKQQNIAVFRFNLLTKRMNNESVSDAALLQEIESLAILEKIEAIQVIGRIARRDGTPLESVLWGESP